VSCWIPSEIPSEKVSPADNVILGRGALAPCHMMFQCFVKPGVHKKQLSLLLYIRSSDTAIGLPTNIAQYAMLLTMLAQVSNMEADELIIDTGDSHIYFNHLETAKEQLNRKPLPLCKITLNPAVTSLFEFKPEDITISDYVSHDPLTYIISL
jgi:thymidylate synthase